MTSLASEPTPEELRAYQAGCLPLDRFEQIDRWLAALEPEAQVRLLDTQTPAASPANPDLLIGDSASNPRAWFTAESNKGRYTPQDRIGAGGMGVVEVVQDQVLDREVALKRCRPRAPDENVECYALRLRSFRREAVITAQLEHPAIIPVHDFGTGPYGEPAFLMKRLDGVPLTEVIAQRQRGERLDLADLIQIVVRVAEAIGHAHDRHIVHRDLKPDNVIVGKLGAVSVIDWGLAASFGGHTGAPLTTGSRGSGLSSFAVGTPEWMAPEQATGAPADPRMDVFALGGLLMGLLTGVGPRSASPATGAAPSNLAGTDLSALTRSDIPPGLAAVARHCLAIAPLDRYADGAAVAADLRRWLSAGVTFAEHPSVLRVLLLRLGRSPKIMTAIGVVAIAALVATVVEIQHQSSHHQEVHTRVERLMARVALDDPGSVRDALQELHDLAGLGKDHDEVTSAELSLTTALESIERRANQDALRQRFERLAAAYRIRGPWPSETTDLDQALRAAGLTIADGHWQADAEIVRRHPLRDFLLGALVQLQRALIVSGTDANLVMKRTIPQVLRAATDSPSWQAVADLLDHTELAAHDLALPAGPEAERALATQATADILLATYGPEARLVRYALGRLATDPGAFWPRVVAARAAIQTNQATEAEHHALVALGAEPVSLWPHLVLAYVALTRTNASEIVGEAEAGLAANPDNLELVMLKAAGLARAGKLADAQALVDRSHAAGHLQYHLQHPVGHPMERTVHALVDAGIRIPEVAPQLGPVVSPERSPAP